MLVFASTGQQIGSVDLTVPLKALKPAENQEQKAPPNGCDKLSDGIIADGWAEPPDRRPLDLVVEVTKVNDANPVIGSELQAEVRMRNGDTRTIEIPWSTDHSIVEAGQNPESLQWNAGTFEFMLRIPHVTQVRLKSLTGWLYSSKFSAGSQLTIQPGESITALVKLKLEDEYAIPPERLKEGEWQLSAEWFQVGRSWSVKDCKTWNGYYHYDRFYWQQNVPATIQVTAPGSHPKNEPTK
jgi:hypothetical protein